MSIGLKIKQLRAKKGLSQSELSDVFHVSTQAVSKWESGTTSPDISQLPAIASYFGITIDELFDYPNDLQYQRIDHIIENGESLTNDLFVSSEHFLLSQINQDPNNHRALSTLADLYHFHACRLNDKAQHYALEALQLKPDNRFDLNTLNNASNGCIIAWNTSSHAKLIATYEKLLKVHPANVLTKEFLIKNLIQDHHFDQAILLLNASNIKNDAFYRTWINEIKYGFDQTKQAYQHLVESDFTHWELIMEVANRYAFNNDYPQAINLYELAYQNAPKPRYTDMLASIRILYETMSNYDKAIDTCQRELSLLKSEWNLTKGELVNELNQHIRYYKSQLKL